MANVSSLKSIWEKTDNSYIQVTKSGINVPVSRRIFPETKSDRNHLDTELHWTTNGSECDDASEDGWNLDNFDAIPEEFRPSKEGKLLKVKTSPKKVYSQETVGAEEPEQNKRYSMKRKESPRNRNSRNSNSPATQKETVNWNSSASQNQTKNSNSSAAKNESRNYKKETFKTEKSEPPQQNIDVISDETGRQNELEEMFFYESSFRNESTVKATRGRQENRGGRVNSRSQSSEKSKLKNMQDKSTQNRFFNSGSSQSKMTNEFDCNESFAQNKDDMNSPKCNQNPSRSFQNSSTSSQNKVAFGEKGIREITRETTVTKRIQWKSDLCRFKKPENKSNSFYEYTKTTKQSMSFVSSHSEDEDEVTKKSYEDFRKKRNFCNDFHQDFKKEGRYCNDYRQDFKKERNFRNHFGHDFKKDGNFCNDFRQDFKKGRSFCNDFRRSSFVHHNGDPNQRSDNRNYKGFDSTNEPQRKETKNFYPGRPQRPFYKFEEKKSCFQCSKDNDPIIVRHEIKVIHMNGRGRNNRMFHNSSRPTRQPRKDINGNDRHQSDMMMAKTEKITVEKTAETVIPATNLTDSSSKAEYAYDDASLASNTDSSEIAATLMEFGREISDLIAGSHIAISVFLDNYKQWKDFRRVTMLLFEEFEKNLSQCSNKNKKIIEVAEMVGTGCKMVKYVPHPGVSIAARIIASLSDVVLRMFSSSKSVKSIGMDNFQLRLCLQKDMEATSDIYTCGLQCDMQFQETCLLIEEFHSKIKDGNFGKFVETFETGFLKEISLLNPRYPQVFYKRLERFYELLNDSQQSEEGRAFCIAFEEWPDALTTISHLSRRFKTEKWDSSSVLKAWEEIYNLLQNDQSVVEDVLKKVQDCICVLMREQSVMEKYVMDLQRRI